VLVLCAFASLLLFYLTNYVINEGDAENEYASRFNISI
jgi:hypothetical protein